MPKSGVTPKDRESLVSAARRARERAYAPYSNFAVGAAVLYEDGSVVTGCNCENASYGLACCAERVALFRGVAEGKKGVRAIAVVVDSPEPGAPCGACRQVIYEFGPDALVLMANVGQKGFDSMTIRDLLPRAFGPEALT